MSSQNPRDHREWMRILERNQAQLRGIPAIVQQAVGVIIEDAELDKVLHPAAPIELTYQTAFYLDTSSRRRVRFLMDFPDVRFNTDGSDTLIQQYELWAKEETPSALVVTTNSAPSQAAPGMTLPGLVATASNEAIAAEEKPWAQKDTNTESFFRTDGFIAGSIWRFRARAIGVNSVIPGEWSEEIVVTMRDDDTPPPQASAPTLLSSRGQLTVTWNGQAVSGAMPPDFKYAILAHGTESSPTFEVARFGRGGGFKVITDLEYYDPQFFRLRAVDETGNLGPWSEQAVGYTTPLVDKDMIISTIDAAKTHLKNIDAGVSILPNTIITEHLVVTEEMTAAIANFLVVNADMINANSIWADEGWFGLADALLFRGDAFEGKSFEGGVFTTTYGGKFQTDVEDLVGVKLTAKGLDAWSDSGVHTLDFDTATGNLSIFGGTFTGGKFQSSSFANTGVKVDATGVRIWNTSGNLVLDATTSGANFTGRVTSGFGAVKAVLSDNIFDGRPGVQFATGASYWAQPFMTSYGLSADGTNRGALYLSAAWSAANSDPARLMMHTNGSLSLGGRQAVLSFGTGDRVAKLSSGNSAEPNNGYVQVGPSNAFLAANGHSITVRGDGTALISATNGTSIYGGLSVNGSKNFIMDHPTRPGMELLHGSTESPVSGIEYWGEGVVSSHGVGVIELPEYFEALAKPDGRTTFVTGRGGVLDWSDIVDGKVSVYGDVGVKYSWLVKAERFGGDFEVEREAVPRPDTDALVDALASSDQVSA